MTRCLMCYQAEAVLSPGRGGVLGTPVSCSMPLYKLSSRLWVKPCSLVACVQDRGDPTSAAQVTELGGTVRSLAAALVPCGHRRCVFLL